MRSATEPHYPPRLRVGEVEFHLRGDVHAIREAASDGGKGAAAVMRDDEGGALAVHKGRPRGKDTRPVYSAGPDGPLAIPSGLIFVRLRESVRPESRRAQFAKAGFRIARTLSYAPNAAWLRATRGGVRSALNGAEALREIADVVHVEPQMLLERALK